MSDAHRTYLPAAGHNWALPLYDPFVTLLGGGSTRTALVEQAALRPGHRVLDIGCGTGSLVVLVKRRHPEAEVVGLDPDPKALARAAGKARRAAVSVHLDQGFADALPYVDASFDRVFSSFMFHHLPAEAKEPTLREVRRVLAPRGRLLLLDFAGAGRPHGHGSFLRLLRASGTRPDGEDSVLTLMTRAGFRDPKKVREGALFFGRVRLHYYEAVSDG
jgi:SAM-dependent methyltransferase